MGNSGSIHNVATGLEDIDSYFPYGQGQLPEHQPVHWTQSFPRDGHSLQQQHSQIKVLPELNEGPRLRPTTNGVILQSGGTISGRRENLPPPILQRSKTSINYDLSSRNKPEAAARSKIKMGYLQEPDRQQDTAYKRFGSEPDLRVGDEEDNSNIMNKSKFSKSKMVKTKKKKAAPPPPQRNPIEVRPTTNQDLPRVTEPQTVQQKKLRLFKTKAESKKSTLQNKLTSEASDLHFRRTAPDAVLDQRLHESSRQLQQHTASQEGNDFGNDHTDNWKSSRVKVLPINTFRREKSFDISLLANRNTQIEKSIQNSRERHLASGNLHRSAFIPLEKRQAARQASVEPDRPVRKSVIETKMATRKFSQPAQAGSSDFKKELEEATKKRSLVVEITKEQTINKQDTKPLEPPICPVAKSRIPSSRDRISPFKLEALNNTRESMADAKSRSGSRIPQLTKTFYFGMETNAANSKGKDTQNIGKIQMEVIDEFAKNILTDQGQHQATSESSESVLSSEEAYQITGLGSSYSETNDGGIQVHVRPTLPRRQLEIPRFSPAAAWRMLNEEQKELSLLLARSEYANSFPNDLTEPKQPLEERIQRIYREPNPLYPDNKSGDSGISGDAGLPERPESPRQNFIDPEIDRNGKVGPFLTPWTPQQDLEEESSSDGELIKDEDPTKYPSRGHVFSLSLPRESHLSVYEEKEKPGFSSLQKLKKTVSHAFSCTQDRMSNYRSDNWLLSRSAPNSIENSQLPPGNLSTQQKSDTIPDRQMTIQPSSFSYLAGGKHVMYLPNHPAGESSDYQDLDQVNSDYRMRSSDANSSNKSREHSHGKRSVYGTKERESLQDLPLEKAQLDVCNVDLLVQSFDGSCTWKVFRESFKKVDNHQTKGSSSKSRNHRFTFQSTVRQIERRRIAEKLSKEAELKEAQRLSELEAMRRVEEEFQRKRAREKASIRHQLRLFSLEENQCASLPIDWHHDDPQYRAEPDGAVSSPTPSPTSPTDDRQHKSYYDSFDPIDLERPFIPKLLDQNSRKSLGNKTAQIPTTEVLSEFRTMRREYIEYRSDRKHDYRHEPQTEHPPVICKIPSRGNMISTFEDEYGGNSNGMISDNYRREFARGRSVCSSDSEISIPSGGAVAAANRRQRCRSRSPSPSL